MNMSEWEAKIDKGEIKNLGAESFYLKQNENGNGVLVINYLYSDGSKVEVEFQELMFGNFSIMESEGKKSLMIPVESVNGRIGTCRLIPNSIVINEFGKDEVQQ